jgi:probable phosphoglycerate mutase
MTQLYLIRHGEATTQIGVSLHDEGLTPLGVRQAERLRDRLQGTHEIVPDVFIASTLPRARQTAQIIAPAFDNTPLLYDEQVQELYPGIAEQMTVAEFRERFGGYRLDEDPFHPVSPNGETWGQFVLRAGTALNRIITEHEGKTIVVVCHGGIIDVSFIYFLGLETLTTPTTRFDTRNTSITHWGKWTNNPKRPPRWWLARYNDDLHVRGLDANFPIPWSEMPTPPYKEWAQARPQPTKPPTEQ